MTTANLTTRSVSAISLRNEDAVSEIVHTLVLIGTTLRGEYFSNWQPHGHSNE